uniref:Mitochondrial fission 1 protein n=1 Tax=Timema monikensis TaxID=170555 RepID=A0A7R9EBY4_9NEOP|nr:unnamed protein product [Timema monikensis]
MYLVVKAEDTAMSLACLSIASVPRLTLPFQLMQNSDAQANALIGQESAPKPPPPLKDHTCKQQLGGCADGHEAMGAKSSGSPSTSRWCRSSSGNQGRCPCRDHLAISQAIVEQLLQSKDLDKNTDQDYTEKSDIVASISYRPWTYGYGVYRWYSSPVASLVLTDSSQLTSDSQHLVKIGHHKSKFELIYHEQLRAGNVSPKAQFEYAWCLVRSKYSGDIRKGIILLEDLFQTGNVEGKRDYLYYLAIGNARIKEYTQALHFVRAFLQIEPGNQQVHALETIIRKRMEKEGLMGMAVVGGVALAIGGLVGLGIALSKKS